MTGVQTCALPILTLEPACRLDDTQIVLQTVLTKRRLVMFASRSFLFLAELRPEMLDARAGMLVGRYTDRIADSTDK